MTKVFVVILNWNRAKDTVACLKSFRGLTIKDYQLTILVVDNHSTDNSVEVISDIKNQISNLKLIVNNANLGFAGGNNVGCKYALENGADYILILNNDTVVDADFLTELLTTAKNYSDFGLASPKIYFAKGFEFHKNRYQKSDLGKVIWSAGGEIDWANVYGKSRGVDEVDRGQFKQTGQTGFATGTALLIKAEVLNKVGLFDEKYFLYYEDTDLSVRVRKAGYKVLYVPRAKVWHKVAQSSGIGSSLNDYFISRNRLLFGLKYAPVRSKLALIKESLKLYRSGRPWQKIGVRDFYLGKFGQGSWQNNS